MKRFVVVMGFLGLVWTVAMPTANAAVCLQDDFSGTTIKGVGGVYMQGVGILQRADTAVLPFMIRDGVLTSSIPDSTSGSDEVSLVDGDPPGVRFLLLTGEPTWTDVTITTKIKVDTQNTGVVGLVLRAAPKTKPEDPDSWYELRYSTGAPPALPKEEEAGIAAAEFEPQMRIMKVVNGKWSLLAQSTEGQAGVPAINGSGDQNASGATFRFKATGTLLEGFISLNGTDFTKVLEANDAELKAGRVGLVHHDYNPQFDDLQVECP
jgi:hypothetical protein